MSSLSLSKAGGSMTDRDLMSKLRTTRNVLPSMKKCSEVRRHREEKELLRFRSSGTRHQRLLVTFDSLPYVHRLNACMAGRVGSQDDVPGAETQLRTCLSDIEGSQWEKMAVLATKAAETAALTEIDDDGGDGGREGRESREISVGGAETQLQRAVNLACESQWERQAVKASLEAEIQDLERRKHKQAASLLESQETTKSSDFVAKGTETQLLDATRRIADPLWELHAERASLEAEVSTLQAKKTILTEIATQEDEGEHDNQDNNHSSSSTGEASDIAQDNDDGDSACDLASNTTESEVLLTQTDRQASAPAVRNFETQDKDEGWITKQTPCTSPAKPLTQCHRSAQDDLDSLLASSPDADGDGRCGGDVDKERSPQSDDDQKRKVSMSPTKSASSEDIDEPSRKSSLKRIRITLSGPVSERGNHSSKGSKGYQRATAQQQRSDGWLNRRTELDRKHPDFSLLQHCSISSSALTRMIVTRHEEGHWSERASEAHATTQAQGPSPVNNFRLAKYICHCCVEDEDTRKEEDEAEKSGRYVPKILSLLGEFLEGRT